MLDKNSIKICAAFIVGAVAGFGASYKYVSAKKELEKAESIRSITAAFDRRVNDLEKKYSKNSVETKTPKPEIIEDKKEESSKPDLLTYNKKIKEEDYVDYTEYSSDEDEDNIPAIADKPYVIAPNDFCEMDGYNNVTLYYYSDDEIITDDQDEAIDNWIDYIGEDALNHFGEYEEDSVYVRNEEKMCDYQIILNP